MPRLAIPIDAGATWRDGRPVFGRTKTWLGVVIYVGGAAVVACVLGELVNSFVKRRIGIESRERRRSV